MKLAKMQWKGGFSIVEIIVVIGIIGMLSAMGFSSYQNVQRNSRDAKRRSDLQELKTSLAQFYNDSTQYPLGGNLACNSLCGNSNDPQPEWIITLQGTYITTLPVDPLNRTVNTINYRYTYTVAADRQSYTITTPIEGGGTFTVRN